MADSKVLKSLIEYVEKKMKLEGFNQVSLGSAMGLSKQRVNQFITGGHSPRLSTIEAVAKAFNLPIFYLFMTEDERSTWDSKKAPEPSIEQIQKDVAEIKQAILGLDQKAEECKQTIQAILPKTS